MHDIIIKCTNSVFFLCSAFECHFWRRPLGRSKNSYSNTPKIQTTFFLQASNIITSTIFFSDSILYKVVFRASTIPSGWQRWRERTKDSLERIILKLQNVKYSANNIFTNLVGRYLSSQYKSANMIQLTTK